jgi:transposase
MRKQYSAAFKARVVKELLKGEKTLAQIASEYEVHPTQLKNWRAVALEGVMATWYICVKIERESLDSDCSS